MGLLLRDGAPYTWQGVLPFMWQAGAQLTEKDQGVHLRHARSAQGPRTYQSFFTRRSQPERTGEPRRGRAAVRLRRGCLVHLRPLGDGLLTQAGGADFVAKVGSPRSLRGRRPTPATSAAANCRCSRTRRTAMAPGSSSGGSPGTPREVVRPLRRPARRPVGLGRSSSLASDANLAVFGTQLKNAQNAPASPRGRRSPRSSIPRSRRWPRA